GPLLEFPLLRTPNAFGVGGEGKGEEAACIEISLSQMKNWGYATVMYLGDFEAKIPYFGDNSDDYSQQFWHAKLAPYVIKATASGVIFTATDTVSHPLRLFPGRTGLRFYAGYEP